MCCVDCGFSASDGECEVGVVQATKKTFHNDRLNGEMLDFSMHSFVGILGLAMASFTLPIVLFTSKGFMLRYSFV